MEGMGLRTPIESHEVLLKSRFCVNYELKSGFLLNYDSLESPYFDNHRKTMSHQDFIKLEKF
jgi:hypothetical protein